jgi:hypothetical protein
VPPALSESLARVMQNGMRGPFASAGVRKGSPLSSGERRGVRVGRGRGEDGGGARFPQRRGIEGGDDLPAGGASSIRLCAPPAAAVGVTPSMLP